MLTPCLSMYYRRSLVRATFSLSAVLIVAIIFDARNLVAIALRADTDSDAHPQTRTQTSVSLSLSASLSLSVSGTTRIRIRILDLCPNRCPL